MNHDVIVIAASTGGVAPLLELVPHLPRDLRASLFIVLHTVPNWQSPLPELLSTRGPLPARHPLHQEKIAPGHIYIAPPDNHLMLRADGSMAVVRGPRENGHRPAGDALFRSAAASFGARVIGVVLSGHQNCGSAGMLSIRARGGVCVVQQPDSAEAPEMPRSVLDIMAVDHVVTPAALPGLLTQLVASQVTRSREPDAVVAQIEGRQPGAPAGLACPLCHGALQQTKAGEFEHFRCHVGHTFTVESLLHGQNEDLERALWSAVRVLEESATMAQRLSDSGTRELRARFSEKARTHAEQAELIRGILLRGTGMTVDAAS